MKKGEIIEGLVTGYEFPNKGVIVVDDVKVYIKNVLPGQKIKCMIRKKRQNKAQASLIEIIEKAPIQTEEAFCKHFGNCGSCIYQTLSYDSQCAVKEKQVLDLINSVCSDYEYDGIKHNPDILGYRNKMEYTFGDEYKDGPLSLGLHKRGSFYDILDASCCKLVNDDFGRILTCVKDYCIENDIPHYHRVSHEGVLRHLLVRRARKTGELLIDIVTADTDHDFGDLTKRLLDLNLEGSIVGFLHTTNNCIADTIKDEGTEILYGRDYFYEELLGLRFRISPFSFFQTNSNGAEVLYSVARDYIGKYAEGKVVYDLYSGTGTIAQLLASASKQVIGVEIVPEAVEAAKKNALDNGLCNCEFIAGDVLKTLDSIEVLPEVIVLDPPREGVHPKALERIVSYGVENIVYISCKPTSLVNDLKIMQENGYKVERVSMVDMFSWTGHVETVVLLSQQKPDDTIEIDLDLDELDATTAEKKATYEEIKAYVWDKHHLKVSSLYISQVKRKCGLEVGQNYNLSKSENPKVPKCPPEKEAVIMGALKHFQMI